MMHVEQEQSSGVC